MQLSSATQLCIQKFFQNIFYKIYTKSTGDVLIIFSVLSVPFLSSKYCIFSPIFPNYYEFFPSSFNSFFWLLILLVKFLQNFTVVDSFCTLKVVYWRKDICLRTWSEVCARQQCYRAKSREDFSEAGMWGRCSCFWQLETVLKRGDDRVGEEERFTGTAVVGSTSSDIIVAQQLKVPIWNFRHGTI